MRRTTRGLVTAGLAITVITAPMAVGVSAQWANQPKCTARHPGIAVGDSILEDVATYSGASLKRLLGGSKAVVDGKINRQFSDGLYLTRGYLASRTPCAVVLVLGTNGPVTPSQWRQMMNAVRTVPRVVVVNTWTPTSDGTWIQQINSQITALASKYRNVRVADWYRIAVNRSSILESDNIHPNPTGAKVFVNTIQSVLGAK